MKNIIKGVIISLIFTLIFLFVFSIILTYTNISESFIAPVIIVITAISIFIGSSIGNIKLKKNGMLNGALVGGIYLLSIYLLSGIISQNFSLSTQSIIIIVAGMICGMFGGIIGVNKG
ncbi:MAG: TIGR04086 family membrane protein [Clostridia bacterium]|nr:TIGR04086 family membrane protein [Clostridia bacterium]